MTTIALDGRSDFEARRRSNAVLEVGTVVFTVLTATAIAALIIAMTGQHAGRALGALATGPLERPNRFGHWMQETTTLTLLGLSAAIPFRARQISLGAEGQLYVGALAGFVAAMWLPVPPVVGPVLLTVIAALAGAATGAIPGLMKSRLGANEIVATLMVNVIVLQLFDFLITNDLQAPGSVSSESVPANARWTRLDEIFDTRFGQANVGIVVALLAMIGVGWFMSRTGLGYRMKIVGSNPDFARYGGIDVTRTIDWSFVLGGAFAGVAGAHVLFGVYLRLEPGMAGGFGFLGILVALLGRNRPVGIVAAAAFYAYLRVGGDSMERETAVGSEIVLIIQAVIVVMLTARLLPSIVQQFDRRRERGPQIPLEGVSS